MLGLIAVILAGALPVVALAIASRSATSEVRHNTFVGAVATATAVANQANQEYVAAVDRMARLRTSSTTLDALRSDRVDEAVALVPRLMAAGPYDMVAMYDRAGVVRASAGGSSGRIPAMGDTSLTGVSEGPITPVGARTIRQVTVVVDDPSTGQRLGAVVADIDLSRLIGSPATLRFGTTGFSKLVSTDGRILLSADADAGTALQAPENQQIARSHETATVTIFAPYYNRATVEAYVPVADQPFGVLTQQSETEAFAGVRSLANNLRQLQIGFAVFGVALGGAVMFVVARRDRRIVGQNEALAAAQAQFRSAFDDAPSGAALVGLDDRHREVNRALCELTGYTREQLLERTVEDLTHPDDREASQRLSAAVVAGEIDGGNLEKRYLPADGRLIWVNTRISAVKDRDGRPTHTIRHVVDITERRRATDALRDALEREQRASDELRRLEEARTDLLLTVSHDFRSPLAAIAGFNLLLANDWDVLHDEQRRDMLARIARNCDELERRVTNFLEYSRLGEVSAILAAACDVGVVARAALERNEVLLTDKIVRDEIAPGTIVWADTDALGRVLDNLLSNAAKYSPPGSIVRVGATVVGEEVVVNVDDEGPGIPPDQADRIFDRFYRVTEGDGAPKGSGIGLTAVKQLVVLMSGRVWVERSASGGSSFRFTLPSASLLDSSRHVHTPLPQR